jgi:AcrR family transcriptional regulator
VPSRSAEETRRVLLESGLAVLAELTTADLLSAAGTRTIAGRAGVSAATLFHHFGNLEGFAEALLVHLYRGTSLHDDSMESRVRGLDLGRRPTQATADQYRSEFLRLSQDPAVRLRIGLWAMGGEAADAAYVRYVQESDARMTAYAEGVRDTWGLDPRAPFDLAAVVAAQSTLLAGAVIRQLGRAADGAVEDYVRTAAALSLVMLRRPGDRLDLDDRLAEVDHAVSRPRAQGGIAGGTRERILEAADALVRDRDLATVSLSQVARAAHVGTSTVYQLFEGKDALVVALLQRAAAGLDDLPVVTDLATLRVVLVEVASVVAARPELVRAWTTLLVTGELPGSDPLLGSVRRALTQGQTHGVVTSGPPADELAPTLLAALAGRVLRRPGEGPEGAVDHVVAASAAVRIPSSS